VIFAVLMKIVKLEQRNKHLPFGMVATKKWLLSQDMALHAL